MASRNARCLNTTYPVQRCCLLLRLQFHARLPHFRNWWRRISSSAQSMRTPWDYDNRASRGAARNHYRTMTLDEIRAEPVPDLAYQQAHLHLWTTNGFLHEAIDLIGAWGFEYKSCFVWLKPELGCRNYWRVSHEFLLLGVARESPV